MKRDPRLHGLSSDHHHALVLVWCLRHPPGGAASVETAHLARAAFDRDLRPHFDVEETVLLPALRTAGAAALVERTLREHAAIEAALAAIDPADPAPAVRGGSGASHRDR